MWGVGRPDRWSEVDLLLVEAFQIYRSSICKGCGHPLGFTSSDDFALMFPVAQIKCWACAGQETRAEADGDKGPGKGVKRYTKNLMD